MFTASITARLQPSLDAELPSMIAVDTFWDVEQKKKNSRVGCKFVKAKLLNISNINHIPICC